MSATDKIVHGWTWLQNKLEDTVPEWIFEFYEDEKFQGKHTLEVLQNFLVEQILLCLTTVREGFWIEESIYPIVVD